MQQALSLGQKIKNFRKRAGLSQLQLETELEASAGYISRVEVGKIDPSKETLTKLVKILNLKPHEAAPLFGVDIDQSMADIINATQKLTQSQNLDDILQTAVNEIPYKLGLLGASILLIEDDCIRARYQTQTWFTKLVEDLLVKPYNSFQLSLTKPTGNLVVKAIIEQKSQFAPSLRSITVDVMPAELSFMVEKLVGVKSGIVFPMIHNSKAIGAIYFAKDYVDEFETEYSVLESFTSLVASVITKTKK